VVAPNVQEYLVSHGRAGDLGRFRAAAPLVCRRDDQVVVQGGGGLEIGVVLCEAGPLHLRMLRASGQILRPAGPDDRLAADLARERSQLVFEDSRRLATDLGLPLEVLDVEISLDGRQGMVRFLGAAECNIDAFASTLSRRHDLFVLMHNLAVPPAASDGGCGEPNCGRTSGGCTSCGTGGARPDMTEYFAHLRAKMERRDFTPLL
jgi:hypothetical protein